MIFVIEMVSRIWRQQCQMRFNQGVIMAALETLLRAQHHNDMANLVQQRMANDSSEHTKLLQEPVSAPPG